LSGASGFSDMAMSQSIRDYSQVKDAPLDPQGSLSSRVPSRAIVLASKEVQSVLKETGNSVKPKRGKYNRQVSNNSAFPFNCNGISIQGVVYQQFSWM